MRKTVVVPILLLIVIVISCSKKNNPSKTVKEPSLTYAANVKSIIQTKCGPCHIPADGGNKRPLDTYAAVKEELDDIIRRVELPSTERGFMPMRKPALPAEEIAILKKWKESGASE